MQIKLHEFQDHLKAFSPIPHNRGQNAMFFWHDNLESLQMKFAQFWE